MEGRSTTRGQGQHAEDRRQDREGEHPGAKPRVPQDMRDEVGPGGHGKVLPQRPVEEADGGWAHGLPEGGARADRRRIACPTPLGLLERARADLGGINCDW